MAEHDLGIKTTQLQRLAAKHEVRRRGYLDLLQKEDAGEEEVKEREGKRQKEKQKEKAERKEKKKEKKEERKVEKMSACSKGSKKRAREDNAFPWAALDMDFFVCKEFH